MGAQQGKMPGQPPVGYQGSSLPPPPPPLPSARDGIGTNAPAQPRPVSKIKGLKPGILLTEQIQIKFVTLQHRFPDC